MGDEPTRIEGAQTIADPPRRGVRTRTPDAIGLQPGTVVGRYVIVQPLGRGGTSEVMIAHDTQLERNVAIKVLLTDFASESGRMRMIREAQAMAQLSHPNVVSVFDVGTHEGNVFLAMEYVEGETMQHWLRTPRGWREVLSVMKQAGRGLAAAHAAGIVHRDFKPANVIIAKDGRVKVLDFGIARSPGVSGSSTPELPSAPSGDPAPASGSTPSLVPTSLTGDLTEEGTIIGTPGYFAPETVFEHTVDARSDVFSFCVTLWRALYGKAPFDTESVTKYMRAIEEEELTPPPPGKRVPAWVHETARRGLHRDPARRPASMSEVLRALDADPSRRHLARLALALAALAGIGVASGAIHHRRAVREACVAEGEALAPAWNDGARAEVRSAAARAGSGDAAVADRADLVVRALDEFATSWSSEQQSSCEATRVHDTQPAATHERRSACLLGARQQFETAVELLRSGDAPVQRHALDLARDLPPPSVCRGKMADNAYVPLPRDARARADAQEARRLTMRARVLDDSGRRDDALAVAQQARDLAHRSGVAPDEAAAVLVLARVQDHRSEEVPARQAAHDALVLAERSGADRLAGFAASQEAHLAANSFSHLDDARELLDLARAKVDRLGGDEELELAILSTSVIVAGRGNDLRASVDIADKLIARERALYGGANHLVCGHEYNRALSLLDMLDVDAAVAGLRDAATCFEATTSPRDPWLGVVHMVMADALGRRGDVDAARAEVDRALELRATLGPKDQIRASILGLASVLDGLAGRWVQADDEGRRALAIADGQSGWIADQMPNILYALGEARLALADAGEARSLCARGTELLARVGQPSPDKLLEGDTLRCLGEAELALGDVARARTDLERGLALPRRWHSDDLPRTRLALSRALAVEPHPDRARSAQLAEQARDELRALVPTRPWLQPLLDGAERRLASAL